MKVAIAGVGNFGAYLIEEVPKQGHSIVVLTRSRKTQLDVSVTQRETDYSVASLVEALEDVDAVVSAIPAHGGKAYADTHIALLEACKSSGSRCKHVIVSHWANNIEDVPDQPISGHATHGPVLEAFQAQNEVNWTMVSNGWISDYILPKSQRHLNDIGDAWPGDNATKTWTMYELGDQKIDFTSSRDIAAAAARLVTAAEQGKRWPDFIYVSGEATTWRTVWELMKQRDPEWKMSKKSLAQSIAQLHDPASDDWTRFVAEFEIIGYSGSLHMPPQKVAAHRQEFFQGLKFRTLVELADEGAGYPQKIL